MNIRVLKDRSVEKLSYNKDGTQNENYATTLYFDFPKYVDKNGEQISVSTLNKYIVFDINGEANEDLIIDNKYSLTIDVTQYKNIKACIYLKEQSLDDDMTNKLIWISDIFPLDLYPSIKEKNMITPEQIDAFNTLYSELNLTLIDVKALKTWIEGFQADVEAGVYNGKSIEYDWQGTALGVRIEGETQYEYTNLKGEKGDCNFATFDIENGYLIMNKDENMNIDFEINNANLEVIING